MQGDDNKTHFKCDVQVLSLRHMYYPCARPLCEDSVCHVRITSRRVVRVVIVLDRYVGTVCVM